MAARNQVKDQFVERFALLTGSFSNGWDFQRIILGAEAAEDEAVSQMAKGVMAEAIRVLWPSELSSDLDDEDHVGGTTYLAVRECGVSEGITIYGPFADESEAEEIGEEYRPEDGDYSVLEDPDKVSMLELDAGDDEEQQPLSKKDSDEFKGYLRNCTDAQVEGVLAKESEANRQGYVALAEAEMQRRGLSQ